MSYEFRFLHNKFLKSAAAALLGLIAFILIQGTAHAAAPIPSQYLPNAPDFSQGNGVWLTVANADNVNFLLTARSSVVRLYSPTRSVTLTITNGGHCPGNGPDQGAGEGEAQTRFRFRSLTYDASRYSYVSAPYSDMGDANVAAGDRYSNQVGCGGYPITLTNQGAPVPNTAGGYTQRGQFAFEIRALWQTDGAFGWNQFKLQTSSGRLSYYAGSDDHFALKANDSLAYPGGSGSFSMGFAPNCLLDDNVSRTVRVYWYDADAGQPNQGGASPVKTSFIEYDANNNQTSSSVQIGATSGAYDAGAGQLYITSPNGVGGWADITIRGHHKYRWTWFGIRTANGIQFKLPADSFNTLFDFTQDCNPSAARATCNVTASDTTPTVGQQITIKVTVTNASGAGGPDFDTNFQIRQVSPAGQAKFLTQNLSPGQTDNNIPAFGPISRASPQSVIFQYAVFDGSTASANNIGPSPPCSVTVNWGGVTSGNMEVGCSQTKVYGINVNDNWHPPAGASPTIPPRQLNPVKATRVPARIVITDPSDGSSFTYNLPNGVPNDGSVEAVSTFDMWSAMWPHKTYNLRLDIQGDANFHDSLTYNNNGKWDADYYPITTGLATGSIGDCLDAYCGQGSSPDVEPGQRTNLSYGVNVVNRTSRTYSSNDGNGYHFTVNSDGGVTSISGASANPDIFPGDPTVVNVSFSARVDWTGGFWVTMYFQGSPISLSRLSNPCPPANVTPATKGYFEVRGADLSTGGGFGSPVDGSCSATAPGYISPANGYASGSGSYDYAGGIRAYGNWSDNSGSKAQYGAYSLGLDIGSISGPIGLFSQNGQLAANVGVPVGNVGGYMDPRGTSAAHCVHDFFTKERIDPNPPSSSGTLSTDISGCSSRCEYLSSTGMTITGGTIPAGKQVTLYVDGNVTIKGNITLAKQFDPTDQKNVPYFALIVRGNITLTNSVTQLDGLYVAQPKAGSGGEFLTCLEQLLCTNQLVVNGAVIAQQVSLTRAHGTSASLEADRNGLCDPYGPANCPPAEVFNYVPSMIIGLPEFSQGHNDVESLFSLPPVF